MESELSWLLSVALDAEEALSVVELARLSEDELGLEVLLELLWVELVLVVELEFFEVEVVVEVVVVVVVVGFTLVLLPELVALVSVEAEGLESSLVLVDSSSLALLSSLSSSSTSLPGLGSASQL